MKKYELIKNHIEVSWKERMKIAEGVTLSTDGDDPKIIDSFETLEAAEAELQKFKSSISELSGGAGKYYLVEEYYIEENYYDEDGEWIEGGDVFGFSKITIELVEKPSYKTLATFDNMSDAQDALDNYAGENKVYLGFK